MARSITLKISRLRIFFEHLFHGGAFIMNSLTSISLAILLTVSLSLSARAASPVMDAGATGTGDLKAHLEGKDAFSVIPPKRWSAHVDDAEAKGMYAYFIMNGHTYADSPALIYVRLLDKEGLSVSEHLKRDMDGYRKSKDKNGVRFEPFAVSGLNYTHAEKKYVYAKNSCDYVCFIDPGKEEASYLVFVLNAEYKKCDAYKNDFETMLRSFIWNGNKIPPPPAGGR
jgi:hypothetical protein